VRHELFSPSIEQVLQATVMKQLEVTESIDEVILSKLHVRSNGYVSFDLD
jgi:F0F1-type ATP synthase delta subunit